MLRTTNNSKQSPTHKQKDAVGSAKNDTNAQSSQSSLAVVVLDSANGQVAQQSVGQDARIPFDYNPFLPLSTGDEKPVSSQQVVNGAVHLYNQQQPRTAQSNTSNLNSHNDESTSASGQNMQFLDHFSQLNVHDPKQQTGGWGPFKAPKEAKSPTSAQEDFLNRSDSESSSQFYQDETQHHSNLPSAPGEKDSQYQRQTANFAVSPQELSPYFKEDQMTLEDSNKNRHRLESNGGVAAGGTSPLLLNNKERDTSSPQKISSRTAVKNPRDLEIVNEELNKTACFSPTSHHHQPSSTSITPSESRAQQQQPAGFFKRPFQTKKSSDIQLTKKLPEGSSFLDRMSADQQSPSATPALTYPEKVNFQSKLMLLDTSQVKPLALSAQNSTMNANQKQILPQSGTKQPDQVRMIVVSPRNDQTPPPPKLNIVTSPQNQTRNNGAKHFSKQNSAQSNTCPLESLRVVGKTQSGGPTNINLESVALAQDKKQNTPQIKTHHQHQQQVVKLNRSQIKSVTFSPKQERSNAAANRPLLFQDGDQMVGSPSAAISRRHTVTNPNESQHYVPGRANENFRPQPMWLDKTPFDQTLKPTHQADLAIRKFQSQEQTTSSSLMQQAPQKQRSLKSHRLNEDAQRRVGNFQPEQRLQSIATDQSINTDQFIQHSIGNQQHRQRQQQVINEVFSPQRSPAAAISGQQPLVLSALESPKLVDPNISSSQNNSFKKTAAQIGLMLVTNNQTPLEMSTSMTSATGQYLLTGGSETPFMEMQQQQAQQQYRQSNMAVGVIDFEETLNSPHHGQPQIHQNTPLQKRLTYNQQQQQSDSLEFHVRKISSQGTCLLPSSQKLQDQMGDIINMPQPGVLPIHYQTAGHANNMQEAFNCAHELSTRGTQRLKNQTQGSNQSSVPLGQTSPMIARPSLSKNIPQCFRENPNAHRQKIRAQIVSSSDQLNFSTQTKAPFTPSHANAQLTGPPAQKQMPRSFSNDARALLHGGSKVASNEYHQVAHPQVQYNSYSSASEVAQQFSRLPHATASTPQHQLY